MDALDVDVVGSDASANPSLYSNLVPGALGWSRGFGIWDGYARGVFLCFGLGVVIVDWIGLWCLISVQRFILRELVLWKLALTSVFRP